jgi:glyoxylase-like metal-dependent hydrolase (beta-lactamase superfamily II)
MPYVNKFMDIQYDTLLSGGEIFQISDMRVEIIYTPGHSKESICILVNGKYLFVGDTIYNDNISNTDIDSGNDPDIIKLIKEKILPLNDSLIVFQGHGDSKILKELKLKFTN